MSGGVLAGALPTAFAIGAFTVASAPGALAQGAPDAAFNDPLQHLNHAGAEKFSDLLRALEAKRLKRFHFTVGEDLFRLLAEGAQIACHLFGLGLLGELLEARLEFPRGALGRRDQARLMKRNNTPRAMMNAPTDSTRL